MLHLADVTTLRVGGPAPDVVTAESAHALIEAVRSADDDATDVLVLGGGSNVVVCDDPFEGRVVLVRTRGISPQVDACGGAWVSVAAGEPWDRVVEQAVAEGWVGIEALSGIPGTVGATPIQNVGAYGQEVADTIARVDLWDRRRSQPVTWAAADCGFGYRTSRLKAEPGRFVVLGVTFQFRLGDLAAPVRYRELADHLDITIGQRAPAADVRAAVLELRGRKGMVLDALDRDTWSVGSFFVNPVLSDPARVPAGAPVWPQADGTVKTSAAWLVEQAGFGKGWRATPQAPAGLSTKHALAITNRGGARASDVLDVARTVRAGVHDRFGIRLEAEPTLVGCALD